MFMVAAIFQALDTDRAVENEEHYQKTTVTNVQSQQATMADEEVMQKVVVKEDEFSGLIGNIAGNLIRDRVRLLSDNGALT
ncbi:hypothetical protein COOONC_04448 [Cooperia oncophora]